MQIPHWIVSDLDETLLRNDKSISDYTLTTLKKIRALGAKFAIATTRNYAYAQTLIDLLQPDAMAVSGGAVAYVGEELTYCKVLPTEIVTETLLLLEKLNATFVIDSNRGRFDQEQLAQIPSEAKVYQILLSLNAGAATELVALSPTVAVTPLWRADLYRLAHQEATKLTALQSITSTVNPQHVIAFGDDPMDVPMLSYYQGVAVANAQPAVRQAARYKTLSNQEDGVAHWLAQQLLSTRKDF